MTSGKAAGQIIKPIPQSGALSEFSDDAQSDRVAADAGQMLTQKVGGSAEIAGGSRADYFDVMALPVHLPAAGNTRRCLDKGAEIGDCKPEGRIGPDRMKERRDGVGHIGCLLCSAIEGGTLDVCRDRPTVVIDRGTGRGWVATAYVGLSWAMHNYQVGPLA